MRTATWETAFGKLWKCSEAARGGARLYRSLRQGHMVGNINRLVLIKKIDMSSWDFSTFLCLGKHRVWVHWKSFIFIHTLAISGPYPVFSYSWISLGLAVKLAAIWLLDGRYFFSLAGFPRRLTSPAVVAAIAWWLWHHLFTDMAGNIPFLSRTSQPVAPPKKASSWGNEIPTVDASWSWLKICRAIPRWGYCQEHPHLHWELN